jgi:hypothetical protein
MTSHKDWLSDYQENGSSGLEVTIANDEKLSCNGTGNVSVQLNTTVSQQLPMKRMYLNLLLSSMLMVAKCWMMLTVPLRER